MNRVVQERSAGAVAAGEPILTATGLRLGYDGRAVLNDVHLEVHGGEFWFLIGPNGQGKSTLLQAIMGNLAPLSGRIERRGDCARHANIGFVPQQCALNPTLPTTVREFVQLGTVGIRAPRQERRQRLAWALDRAGLEGLERADYWSLSGGQRQRALIARALVRRPQLLIADEPTSGLDLSVEAALLGSLASLNRTEQVTVIMVMHDLAVAARYGTHFALVHGGVVQAGTAREILTPENLQRAYGVAVTIRCEGSGSVSVRLGAQENADARA